MEYGSESLYSPLWILVNSGMGILQISNRNNHLPDIAFEQGIKNVSYNLSHPITAIEQYGWDNFLRQEVFPSSIKLKNAQYFPNYSLHMIGGGFTYRKFSDWYKIKGFRHPRLFAFSSLMTTHFLNEVVENNNYIGPNVDPVADFYIFNPLGVLIFSSDKVCRFFRNTLHMQDWSFLSGINLRHKSIYNVGQNFVIKIDIPKTEKFQIMYHWGCHGMLGLSYNRTKTQCFSVAGGLVAKDLINIQHENNVRELTTELIWTCGVFYDRNNSLLASLILSGTKGYKARLNVYPGMIKTKHFSPSLFINLTQDNQVITGLGFRFFPFLLSQAL